MFKTLIAIAVGATLTLPVNAKTPEQKLIDKIIELNPNQNFEIPTHNWDNLEVSISKSAYPTKALGDKQTCQDQNFESYFTNYSVGFDDAGEICRIYDLSFLHFGLMGNEPESSLTSGSISAQKFQAIDYYHWLIGDYESVYSKIDTYENANGDSRSQLTAQWVRKLKFKSSFKPDALTQENIPVSFYASDLNTTGMKNDRQQFRQIRKALIYLAGSQQSSSLSKNLDTWIANMENPQTLLENIKFDWDDVKKIYKIIIQSDFLPLGPGPIVLVDTGTPYKLFVEKVARQLAEQFIESVIRFIPGVNGSFIDFAVGEAFDIVNRAYNYQMNRLEATLRKDLKSESPLLNRRVVDKSINILYLNHMDIISEYVLRLIQGRSFPWDKLPELGRRQRYITEKARDVMMDKTHNALVKKKGCQTELVHNYFANCTVDNNKKMYNLIHTNEVFGFSLGSSMTYNYQSPYSVLVKRSVSTVLMASVYLVDLAIPRAIKRFLSNILSGFATGGITHEGFLLSDVTNSPSNSSEQMRKALLLQNLNPFTPKTLAQEQRVIEANKEILNKRGN